MYDPSLGSPPPQVHDISPGNGENIDDPDPVFHLPGLFWLVRLDDDAFEVDYEDGRLTADLKVQKLLEFDRFQLLGPGNVAMHLTFDTTYSTTGKPTVRVPLSSDPLSPFNWAGKMWEATAKGKFSASSDDGSFSVTGKMDSALATEGAPGHMGYEQNGVFVGSEAK